MPDDTYPRLEAGDLTLIELVGRGWTDDRIARDAGISRATLQRRLQRVSRDLGASSRVTIIVRAIQVDAIDCEAIKGWPVEADSSAT